MPLLLEEKKLRGQLRSSQDQHYFSSEDGCRSDDERGTEQPPRFSHLDYSVDVKVPRSEEEGHKDGCRGERRTDSQ